jgi:hypothetical protein
VTYKHLHAGTRTYVRTYVLHLTYCSQLMEYLNEHCCSSLLQSCIQ